MEAEIQISCHCGNKEQRDRFYEFLDDETRPILIDDVAEDCHYLFESLDDLSSPDWLEKHKEMILHMRWWLGGGDVMAEMNATIDDLLCAGAFDVYCALSFDGQITTLFLGNHDQVKSIDPFDKKRFKALECNQDTEEDDIYSFFNDQRDAAKLG